MNQAYRELAYEGGYIDRAVKLVSLQYLVGSMVDVIGAELEQTLERANLMNAKKTISIQNALQKATNEYYKFFGGVMKKDSVTDWASDIRDLGSGALQVRGHQRIATKTKSNEGSERLLLRKNMV